MVSEVTWNSTPFALELSEHSVRVVVGKRQPVGFNFHDT